jgi:hypothetical protein
MNLWIEQYLKPFVKQQGQDNWVEYLPIAEFAHNSWPHDVTKKSPHELLIGVTFFLLTTVHITDYHWDRHPYFVIHSHHAQTMTHTPPSDDSLLVYLLVVPVACDSD